MTIEHMRRRYVMGKACGNRGWATASRVEKSGIFDTLKSLIRAFMSPFVGHSLRRSSLMVLLPNSRAIGGGEYDFTGGKLQK